MSPALPQHAPSLAPKVVDAFIFYALLALIVLTAIPYGTVEPWWVALFQCSVFLLAALSVLLKLIQANGHRDYYLFCRNLLWTILAFLAFAFLQTLTLPAFLRSANDQRVTISADVPATRAWIVQVLALLLVGLLLLTHANVVARRRRLIEVIIAVGVASALFGLIRQATQHSIGFGLPDLRPAYGYAQFINANHFAFLMELALGLALGLVVCRGVSGTRAVIYLVAAVPMWIGVVLCGSRGGILSLLCQVLILAFLFTLRPDSPKSGKAASDFAGQLLALSRSVAVRGLLLTGVLLAAITTVVLVGGDPLAGRVDSLAVEMDRNVADVYTLRPNIWRATWHLIREHPLAGVGFGGYWIAITKYHVGSGETTPQEAHNDYLELLASGGVIGIALGLWLVWALAKAVRRKLAYVQRVDATESSGSFARAATLGALTGILTVAVHSLVDFGLHVTVNAVVFTVLIAIVCMKTSDE